MLRLADDIAPYLTVRAAGRAVRGGWFCQTDSRTW